MHDKPNETLTARQVQLMFGVDRSTVYPLAAHDRLPVVKIGRHWRSPADEIERFAVHDDAGTVGRASTGMAVPARQTSTDTREGARAPLEVLQ